MGLAVASVFETANLLAEDDFYDVRFISEAGGSVRTSIGLKLETERFNGSVFDTIIVGGASLSEPVSPGLIKLLQKSFTRSRRVAGICTGAFVLAQAGLLNGRRATTHWFHARDLQAQFPKIVVEEDRIFINDGPIWTSAGMTAGLDLALALVENDLGQEPTRSVARKLVLYHRRAGGQSQFSSLLELEPKSDRIRSALLFARENLSKPLSVGDLAEVAHLSSRQFSRAFHSETGQSPAKAIENMRVEAARVMLEQSRHSIDVIAQQTGFSDRDQLRRAFLRAFGQPPQAIRRNARSEMDDQPRLAS